MLPFCIATAESVAVIDTSVGDNLEDENEMLERLKPDEADALPPSRLMELWDSPLDLSTASAEELCRIPGVTPMLAQRILQARNRGELKTTEQLLLVQGIDVDLLARIRPFIRTEEDGLQNPASGYSLAARLRGSKDGELPVGFSDGKFLGSPLASYERVMFRNGIGETQLVHLREAGILFKKDAGEPLQAGSSSWFTLWDVPSLSSRVIVGDYSINASEGLILWRSLGSGSGSESVANVRRNGSGLSPFLSTDENRFFRGLAWQMADESVSMTLFTSSRRLNASVDSAGTVGNLSSMDQFRTAGDLLQRNALHESITGLNGWVSFLTGFKLGATFYEAAYDKKFRVSDVTQDWRDRFAPGSVDVSWTGVQTNVFVEIGKDQGPALACVGGVILQPSHNLELALLYRSYPEHFFSVHGAGFGETGDMPSDERGTYVAFRWGATDAVRLTGYYDQFVLPAPTQTLMVPSSGDDAYCLGEVGLTRGISLSIQLRVRNGPEVASGLDLLERGVSSVEERERRTVRLQLSSRQSSGAQWSGGIEYIGLSAIDGSSADHGLLVSEQLQIKPKSFLVAEARVSVFDTQSYDSRVFGLEPNVPGAVSNPSLYGKGVRTFIIVRVEAWRRCWISSKYSSTVHFGVHSLGSGSDLIPGDAESNITMQVDFQL